MKLSGNPRNWLRQMLYLCALAMLIGGCSPEAGQVSESPQLEPRTETSTPEPAETPEAVPKEIPPIEEQPQATAEPPTEEPADDEPAVPVTVFSAADASRFLSQATFGANKPDIDYLYETSQNYEHWIDEQIALPPSLHSVIPHRPSRDGRFDVWWKLSVDAPDQLRQRVAFALSQILVISDRPDILLNNPDAVIGYYDLLLTHAFGNYRALLKDVTVNLAMGVYLSLADSQKADPETGIRPDENYAREIMQLFTIGLVELNPDGSRKISEGTTIPTYTQTDVEELARIFSGWKADYAGSDGSFFSKPMKGYEEDHDNGEKVFLGQAVPAGLTVEEDLDNALDIIFNHPNVGPFISRQLIQRLVTSNPSPAYVERVAAVFNDNGSGVRGDLGATIKAVLLDDEARIYDENNITFGKLREPLLRATHLFRVAHGRIDEGTYWRPATDFLQAPLNAPTVFNFYFPDFSPAGVIQDAGMVAPEFQITTTSSIATITNKLYAMATGSPFASSSIDVSDFSALSTDPEAFLDYLDLVFMANTMSAEMKNNLKDYMNAHSSLEEEVMTRDVLNLILTSAEYAVQR
ncbi:MAG: DUF1800 family protein [Thiotrichales bacterium]